jgi:Fe(II)/alpha-ketoglutarate-dependent arginine beta-hydroxylase
MIRYRFDHKDLATACGIVQTLAKQYDCVDDLAFLRDASLAAHELPRSVRELLWDFKLSEPVEGICLLSGWPVDDERLGPTPGHWKGLHSRQTLQEEVILMLLGSLLGEPMGWSTQQDGKLIHNVFPIRDHEDEQLGTGSAQVLHWHTEDAFHPLRPDYVVLLCLRNPDSVATTCGSLKQVSLEQWQIDRLFEPHYTIRPDHSHTPINCGGEGAELAALYAGIRSMSIKPDRVSALYGHRSAPYLRLDPYFMDRVEENLQAQRALEILIQDIDRTITDIVLSPGDFCILNNHRAVHGRKSFRARFDGTDRWLIRLLVTTDLRRSRANRRSTQDRILY